MSGALAAALAALLCAQAPPGPEPAPKDGPAALPPPSTVRAVLAHRKELGIDEGQAAQLLQIQARLDRENDETRNRLHAPAPGRSGSLAANPDGRRHLGRQDGRKGDEPVGREEALANALADNDTRAFLGAEPIFRPGQWERALRIAEKYRMDYADEREALQRRATGPSR